jgi:hypothetical protein
LEPGFPPELFEVTFDRTRTLGFLTTAHAAEAACASSVWGGSPHWTISAAG